MVLQRIGVILWGIYIHVRAEIDGGLHVSHFGGVIIGPIKMGKDCNIAHGVTIGKRAGGNPGVPTIGDRVWIGCGSVVFGGITIGDGATIGPLTVVGRNLQPRVLVTGNPMRIVRRDYDNSAEIYGPNE
jgi:serine O-acetyltransferase